MVKMSLFTLLKHIYKKLDDVYESIFRTSQHSPKKDITNYMVVCTWLYFPNFFHDLTN